MLSLAPLRAVFTVFLMLACVVLTNRAAMALDVTSVRFGLHPDRQRAVIELTEKAEFRTFVMTNPSRIVVDLPDFAWKVGMIPRPEHSIQDVRYGALGAGLSRIVIETTGPVTIDSAFMLPKQNGAPDRLVIDFRKAAVSSMESARNQVLGPLRGAIEPDQPVASPAPSARNSVASAGASASIPLPPRKTMSSAKTYGTTSPVEKPLVIIDPGHGGQDPGAIGANGMFEKTIVLAVGKELKKQLEDSGEYRVKMTRETDIFIPLRQRVNIARKSKGDLFISLHADSIRDSNVTGASVYTLSDVASDKETEKLAERENKSDLIAGVDLSGQEDDVASILIDLAARDTMNQSRFLANTVVSVMDGQGLDTLERAHRSAGFAVLKAVDIPSILVEMGYLTNRREVERLSSPAHRQKIASALKASIDGYFQKVSK
jgi:N-acetylmuramoyl-L-alanine amidase